MNSKHVPWGSFLRRFVTLGLTGFGGPPAHVAQLRRQWVDAGDVDAAEFNDAFAAASLLPGPASTQTALWVGWRTRGWSGLLLAGLLFITPSVFLVTVLASQLGGSSALSHLVGAAARGAAIAVPAVAWWSAWTPLRSSLARHAVHSTSWRLRVFTAALGLLGGLWSSRVNPVVIILLAGIVSLAWVRRSTTTFALTSLGGGVSGGLIGLALKVGVLSFGGGFVIVAMMRSDAVSVHHWMTNATFGSAVALGQVTPGPVVATIAAIGYFAGGTSGAVLAATVAFLPSFVLVGLGAPHFTRLRTSPVVAAFFLGASSSALGLIAASGVLLTAGFSAWWEWLGAAVAVVAGWKCKPLWLLGAGSALGLLHFALAR